MELIFLLSIIPSIVLFFLWRSDHYKLLSLESRLRILHINKLFALINRGDFDDADKMCNELMIAFGRDDDALVDAQTSIKNRIWEEKFELPD